MQMELGAEFLPVLDRVLTQVAVEDAFEKYRIYKFITFEEREAQITASSGSREHGPTNVTSDQTAAIATFNVDTRVMRQKYCERVERIVERLPPLEKTLLKERYMTSESEYITDQNVYSFKFNPPISRPTYEKIRWKAFYKFALNMNIEVTMNSID